MATLMMNAQLQPADREGLPWGGEQTVNTAATVRRQFAAAIREGAAGRESTVAFVERAITNALAGMLFVDAESIDSAKSVADFGVDSLIVVQLQCWSLEALGTNINLCDLLDPSESIRMRAAGITNAALGVEV